MPMMENCELTEYEKERQPQEVNMDSEMAISPRSLYREIVCPICMDILNQTRAAPDCLHRFCKKCVEKAVKKDCPVCKKKLPSQIKSFREDPKFDQLIAKIYHGYHASKPLDVPKPTAAVECEIVLKDLNGQQTRYLKCPENTTVDHLTRYLAMRPEGSREPLVDNNEEYGLCIVADPSKGRFDKLLPGTLELVNIKSTYKLSTEQPLELYYYGPSEE